MAKDIPSGQGRHYRRGFSDSLLEDKKDYDGVFLPFDLPHTDAAVNAYKMGRAEGDKMKQESRAYRRGLSDSLLDEKKDYDGRYKPFDLPSSEKNDYKKGRVDGDKMKKEIEEASK